MVAIESKRHNTGEVELSYSEWPGDPPPIVALHGISATRSLLFMENRGRQRGFAYDHRGHGDSGRTPGVYTFVNYGRDAIAFLRGVVREPALLIGHSLGAMTAIYAAANAPELVKAAFLADPPLYAPEQPLRDEQIPFSMARDQAGKAAQELIAAGVPAPRAEMLSRLDADVLGMVLDQSAFAGWDTDAFLRGIECPVVLQHGDRPFAAPPGSPPGMASAIYPGELERAVALIRKCQVLHIPGTGHASWFTKPDEWSQALRSFVQQNSGV